MRLSTRSRYGTRILLELSRRIGQEPVQVSEISKKQQIPVKYLEQLIRVLKQEGLVKSIRGPKGGHVMIKNPAEVTLGQLVRLFEEKTELVGCISEPEKCTMSDDCRVRVAWMKATDALYGILDSITIQDILQTNPTTATVGVIDSSLLNCSAEKLSNRKPGSGCAPNKFTE